MSPSRAVAQINKLERCMLETALIAQKRHQSMTGGSWLWHGPESFLHVLIAERLAKKTGHSAYVDVSIGTIRKEMRGGPGRPAKNTGQRPDISIWEKSSPGLRAVVEVKCTMNVRSIRHDTKKMEKWLKQVRGPKSAYMFAYSEAKGANRKTTLKDRFDHWAKLTAWDKIGYDVHDDRSDPEWAWGVVLLRKNKR